MADFKPSDCNSEPSRNVHDKLAIARNVFTASKTNQAVSLRLRVGQDLESIQVETVHDLLYSAVRKHPKLNFLASQSSIKDEWEFVTYKGMYDQCWKVAKSLLEVGLERYKAVCLLGFTSPRWFYAFIGAILAGGVGCGIYTTNKSEACHYVLEKSQANIVVVENEIQLEKIIKVWDRLPCLKAVVQYTGDVGKSHDRIYSWSEFLNLGQAVTDDRLRDVIESQKVNECCQIIFTSGTTGNPKGVLLSHDNVTNTARSMVEWAKLSHEIILSYLPLSHIAAQISDIWIAIASGSSVYFAQPDVLKGSLSPTLKAVRPTFFIAVPRVWEKIVQKLQMVQQTQNQTFLRRKLFEICQNIGWKSVAMKAAGSSDVPFGFALADSLVFKRVLADLGLDRCWLFASCAAPLAEDTQAHMWKLNIPLIEMYGLTESSGPHTACFNSPGSFKYRSVGRTMPVHCTKLADDGYSEICIWGRNVMMGYLDMPEATARVIDEKGWFHTGDLGELKDEFLYVTGRIKDIIITAGGENIPSVMIEKKIKEEIPLIGNCILIGDEHRFLSVLITVQCDCDQHGDVTDRLSAETIKHLRNCGSSASSVHELLSGRDSHFVAAMRNGFLRVNSRATSRAQTIRKWSMLPNDFSIAGGELGPTMKMRRTFIANKYKKLIESIYAESSNSEFIVYNIA